MEGIRLVEINCELEINNFDYEDGSVEFYPQIKYRYEKTDPLKPINTIRFGKYHQDKFVCKIPVNSDEYLTLLNFLSTVELFDHEIGSGLYIQYDHGTGNNVFPITAIKGLPDSSEELQLMPDIYLLSLLILKVTMDPVYIIGKEKKCLLHLQIIPL